MNASTFNEIYSIMEEAFPPSETRTREGQQMLLDHPYYQLLTECDETGKVAGFLAGWDFPSFRFVEHLAVNSQLRGRGMGQKLLTCFMENAGKPIILEVEPATDEITSRRISFYKRLGFHVNAMGYVQPPLREDQPELPLLIMSYPIPLNEEEFAPLRETLYSEVYKLSSMEHVELIG
ncbi:GNAT family N-acetyltransferase [Paenibacillus sp. JX-17]|uniref:GNAT family N-acetyltransferase n=1 Tax=Paenibacillus lacisoli TaxID=3064525 RepID=A0ABT9CCL7_9BACL|nr:GNAT family N-acetyltransferase [Paenibacillus sp. JX-17]MDO7905368.1 GNAT family N-acetyltransferase [Paenibacillus sp. JX-17]